MKIPTKEEIAEYANAIDLPLIEAEKFFNYYDMVGWKVANKKMKRWQAALRNWKIRFDREFAPRTEGKKLYTYQEVVHINNDNRDKRTFAMFQRTPQGQWVER